ncbi:uncharacterized protein N7483_012510 [Penicillium malachiteum]|uniref:uncharacterized protein n=1 Tax=Penicillium malachiteum TaxID=1324776 RepID=UPI0025476888|nr:uncharacterized protein N7483_012510 [Penicillium malachiteum]KAJ5715329.1 hypothetical protein N7483_012510 [Penicillium malachiteum]
MKLVALSDIVKELRKKMNPLNLWSAAAQILPDKLVDMSLDDLLRVSSSRAKKEADQLSHNQDDIFAQLKGGELKMLVNIASKTGYYNIRFPQS